MQCAVLQLTFDYGGDYTRHWLEHGQAAGGGDAVAGLAPAAQAGLPAGVTECMHDEHELAEDVIGRLPGGGFERPPAAVPPPQDGKND